MKGFKLGVPFEIWGHWWLPDHPDQRLPGKLSSQKGHLELRLLGRFESIDVNSRNLVVPVIHGVGDAKAFTLWRAVQDVPSFKFPGDIEQTFHRLRVIVGAHFSCESETMFSEVSFDAPQIGPWLANRPVSTEHDFENNQIRSIRHVAHVEDRTRIFGPTASGLTYRLGSAISTDGKPYSSHSFHISPGAHIEFYAHVSCGDAIARVERTTELLTLLVGEHVEPAAIQLHIPEEKSGFDFLCEYRPPRDITLIKAEEVLAPLPSLNISFESVLDRWDDQHTCMSDTVNLLRDVIDRDSPASHVQLLLLAQALEAFHRNVHGRSGSFIPKSEYKPIRKALAAAIPDSIPKDLKGALISHLSLANEITLRTRLDRLLDMLSEDALVRIGVDRSTFARDVVRARNGFTHWVKKQDADRQAGAGLANLLSTLLALTKIVVLHHLGVSEDMVVSRMERVPHRHLRRYQSIGESEKD